jgi:hypothetical protein
MMPDSWAGRQLHFKHEGKGENRLADPLLACQAKAELEARSAVIFVPTARF